MADPTHGFGTALCVASVDAETAAPTVERFIVGYDCGAVIDPPSALGQVKGAVAMGLGGALLESIKFADDGQPQSTTFMDYLIPTAQEMPDVEAHIFEMEAVPGNPLGVKGVGEAGIKGVGAAVTNALADAIGSRARFALSELPVRADAISLLIPLDWAADPAAPAADLPSTEPTPAGPASAVPSSAELPAPVPSSAPAPARLGTARLALAAGGASLAAVAAVIVWRLARRDGFLPGRGRGK